MTTESTGELHPATCEQIASLIGSDRVVLFMKGRRGAPQCGFSARVCQMLDHLVADYATVDVLADPALREGIKVFSDWPTIPQLYVEGEFVGGCDIVTEMFGEGTLHERLGVGQPAVATPRIEIGDLAATAFRRILDDAGDSELHLSVDARFLGRLYLGPVEPGERAVEVGGIRIFFDPLTSTRAEGVRIDAVEAPDGPRFRIDNPNAMPPIAPMSVRELKERLETGGPFELLDVRTKEERAIAHIEGSRLLDAEEARRLETLDRETPLVFHCHHGGRSRAAAEHFATLGFHNVFNLEGGIDAWSREIDPSVPRY